MRVRSGDIIIDTFAPTQANGRKLLFLNGFPGAIGPLPGVVAALELGYEVVFPQYAGTYDSDGTFELAEVVDGLNGALDSLAAGTVTDLAGRSADFAAKFHAVVAHSFGAYLFLESARCKPELWPKRAALLAPVTSYAKPAESGILEDLSEHIEMVRLTRPKTYRLGSASAWATYAAGGHLCERPADAWDGQLLVIAGKEDDTFDWNVFPDVVRDSLTESLGGGTLRLVALENAGHGMDELLGDAEGRAAFSNFLG